MPTVPELMQNLIKIYSKIQLIQKYLNGIHEKYNIKIFYSNKNIVISTLFNCDLSGNVDTLIRRLLFWSADELLFDPTKMQKQWSHWLKLEPPYAVYAQVLHKL